MMGPINAKLNHSIINRASHCYIHRRERFETVLYSAFREPPVNGISKTQLASACLREAPPCGAKAGTFLSCLKNNHFFGNLSIIKRDDFKMPPFLDEHPADISLPNFFFSALF
jgi:hypothetical protein